MNLPLVISDSIGYPSDEKVKQVLQSYTAKDMYLIGSFLNEKLIGVIGFQILEYCITIRHLSVLKDHRRSGIGTLLVQYLIQNFKSRIEVETNSSAIEFYSKLGFSYKKIYRKYGDEYIVRYSCERLIYMKSKRLQELKSKISI